MSKITLEGGIQIRTFAPPREFNPLTANTSDLERYGFPLRPDDPRHMERYRSVYEQLKHKYHYVKPIFRVNTDKRHGRLVPQPEGATETSTNWSGGVVYAPSGQSFKWVQGDWVVPNVDPPTENQWYYCASWIGIDGAGSNDVCQAGVECDVYRSGTSVARNTYPWWEWYDDVNKWSEVQITNFAINPGIGLSPCVRGRKML
jgi:peptidase A4-like protein